MPSLCSQNNYLEINFVNKWTTKKQTQDKLVFYKFPLRWGELFIPSLGKMVERGSDKDMRFILVQLAVCCHLQRKRGESPNEVSSYTSCEKGPGIHILPEKRAPELILLPSKRALELIYSLLKVLELCPMHNNCRFHSFSATPSNYFWNRISNIYIWRI